MKYAKDELVLVDSGKNHFKFYELVYDAFGAKVKVERRWGRIGTEGQKKVEIFKDAHAAKTVYFGLLDAKIRKGYRYNN